MKSTEKKTESLNRLSIALIEKYDCSPEEAIKQLQSFALFIDCDEKFLNTKSYQAAILTLINCGKRAFLGGVFLDIPSTIPLLFDWEDKKYLHEIVLDLGGIISKKEKPNFTIKVGKTAENENQIEIFCNNFIGGVISYEDKNDYGNSVNDFALSGVAAGALAIASAFYKVSGLQNLSTEYSSLVSLIEPDNLNLQNIKQIDLENLPKRLWLLGLGHLGQSYIWNLNFLPFKNRKEITIFLQDFDLISEANYSAGLLCENSNISQYKTRTCSNWLEKKGFNTRIIEKGFDATIKRVSEEPYIALSGFDSLEARKNLGEAGFDLIIDCGLGGTIDTFDEIEIHTFTEGLIGPKEIWKDSIQKQLVNKNVYKNFDKGEKCGIIAIDNASKAISSSFVGAIAGALVISELIRSLNQGKLYESLNLSLRNLELREGSSSRNYLIEAARNGYVRI